MYDYTRKQLSLIFTCDPTIVFDHRLFMSRRQNGSTPFIKGGDATLSSL